MLVHQHVPPHLAHHFRQFLPVLFVHVVVVARDGQYAVVGVEPLQDVHEWLRLRHVVVHQVAGEDDEVRLLCVGGVHHVLQHLRMPFEGAQVQVGDL